MTEKKKSSNWLDWVKAFIIALIVTFVVKSFIVSPVVVDGSSMLPTLHDRDRMIVDKLSYRFKDPERFEIVIFHAPEGKDYIKRVIGLPGEHVAVRDNVLYIDNKVVPESYLRKDEVMPINYPIITNDFALENLAGNHLTIPEGYLLVLGDNRSGSKDSRDDEVGLVHMNEVVGKTSIIYWPPKRIQNVKE